MRALLRMIGHLFLDGLRLLVMFEKHHHDMIKKVVISLFVIAIVIAGVMGIKSCLHEEAEDVVMEESIASIEEVRLRGEIYVCSAMIEDFVVKRQVERHLLWADQEHSCVQTMRQKCSYKIDLDRTEYLADDSTMTIYVKLPPVEYVASTQSASFMSDDSNYWAEHLPNTNALKKQVERRIKQRFDTEENRRKASRYAEEAIGDVMSKLGYRVEFVRKLEKKQE